MFLRKIFSFFRKESFYKKKHREKLKSLEKVLNVKIQNQQLFLKALTHRSFVKEEPELNNSNERLEFLGDAVLGLVVADYLFDKFPEKEEGFLTKIRSRFVYKDALFEAAVRLKLDKFVFYKRKFLGGSVEGKKTILADALEAVIGAIYLDSNLETAKSFIFREIIKPNLESGKFKVDKNYKGKLLELTHSLKMESPVYKIIKESGPEHDKLFTVEVIINGEMFGKGEGKNKKAAEQEAAKQALGKLNVKK